MKKAWAWAAIVILAAAGCASGPRSSTSASPASSPPGNGTSSATPSPSATTGALHVTVRGLEHASGGSLVGTLMPGTEAQFADSDRVLGGFGVAVTSDPFTTTQTVTIPQNMPQGVGEGLFPYVTQTPLVLPSGTYVLVLWAAPSQLTPYSRWLPANVAGLRGCHVVFKAVEGRDSDLTVEGLPFHVGGKTLPCTQG